MHQEEESSLVALLGQFRAKVAVEPCSQSTPQAQTPGLASSSPIHYFFNSKALKNSLLWSLLSLRSLGLLYTQN